MVYTDYVLPELDPSLIDKIAESLDYESQQVSRVLSHPALQQALKDLAATVLRDAAEELGEQIPDVLGHSDAVVSTHDLNAFGDHIRGNHS